MFLTVLGSALFLVLLFPVVLGVSAFAVPEQGQAYLAGMTPTSCPTASRMPSKR